MKIGIVTLPLKNNYGGVLQNWALQQVLMDMGHDPITLDAYIRYPMTRYLMSTILSYCYQIVGKKRAFQPRPYNNRICSKFTGRFIRKHIKMTKPMIDYTSSLVKDFNLEAIIVGSDQVWRPKYQKGDIEDMFLRFAFDDDIIRVVYGASFGVDSWEFSEKQTSICKELIKKFDAISVREDGGRVLCDRYLNVKASHVLDPTLLIDTNRYKELCKKCTVDTSNTIVVYCLDNFNENRERFEKIANDNNLKLKMFTADSNISISVEQWLALFRDASFIVTDSFHGTIFSIIFQKPFFTIINQSRGGSRFISLLRWLGMEDRIYTDNMIYSRDINWSDVNRRLTKLKAESWQFINDALKSNPS